MKYVSFNEKEKAKLFDEIAEHFYNANFGQMSKTDFELLMFHIYYEKMLEQSKRIDNTIDYNRCSDYRISKDLGITQQRVRNLKVKNQLVYSSKQEDDDWKKELAYLTEHAHYDDKKVILNIPDPNLYYEIQNWIEEQGFYVEKQLNSKILQIRAEYYIALIAGTDRNKDDVIRELRKMIKENDKDDKALDSADIGKAIIEGAVNITTIAANLTSVISPDNLIGCALLKLLKSKG